VSQSNQPPGPRNDAAAARNYHSAVSLHQQGKLREAERLYRAVLAINDSDFDCLHNLGLLLAQEGRLDDALGLLRAAAQQNPRSVEVHNNLANVLAILRRHEEAIACFRLAITLKPDFAEAYNNLGNVLVAQGRSDEAREHYTRAVSLRPDYIDAYVNLGDILKILKRPQEAVAAYRQALAKGGDGELIRYYLASLGAERAPAAAPKHLVSAVFDRYSDHYDQHMAEALKCRTPELLFDAMLPLAPSGRLDILDLGCGTGLLGARLRPLARTLTGVDISPNMLARARQRQIYDALICSELIEFLRMQTRRFDIAAAADVFVYMGDLSPVFQEIHATLRDGGLFGLSVEAGEEQDFVLRSTMRFAHSAAYLRKLSADHGFVLESIESSVIRQEAGNDVLGHLAVLRRA
jgi:predicted TPR repeat methyltransferase